MIERLKRLTQLVLVTLAVTTQLTGCSRTVQWEEEVPLNTGEVIWLKRSVSWAYQAETANPAKYLMAPNVDEGKYEFEYRGKKYYYDGGAAIMVIAISSESKPVLVAQSADWAWDSKNSYFCVTPQYVQFMPDASGRQWTWPNKIEPWLYYLPANVLANIPNLKEDRKSRYTVTDRNSRDKLYWHQDPSGAKIEPEFTSTCITDPSSFINKAPSWRNK